MVQRFGKMPVFEILIATMQRRDLSFLKRLFPDGNFLAFSILIVNQTQQNYLLESPYPNIRVLNTFTYGLAKSRNLALQHARGNICLLADDDVCFVRGFEQRIMEAYTRYPEAAVICFKTQTKEGKLYRKYAKRTHRITGKMLKNILSIEVSFKPDSIRKQNIVFNEWFGLGGKFEDSETFFFLRRLIQKDAMLLFYPAVVVMHEGESSSDEANSERIVYARMAGYYKVYQRGAYFLLLKYMFFLWRTYHMTYRELFRKFKTGLKGISDYKYLVSKGLERR